jgi:hypothetical protein
LRRPVETVSEEARAKVQAIAQANQRHQKAGSTKKSNAYALVGREQEAREALAHYLKLWPNTTLETFRPSIGTAAFNSNMQRVLEGLRLAGLPE